MTPTFSYRNPPGAGSRWPSMLTSPPPISSFALHVCRSGPLPNSVESYLVVWEVTLLLGDSGRGIGLTGELRARSTDRPHVFRSNLVLCGRYTAHFVAEPTNGWSFRCQPWDGDGQSYNQQIGMLNDCRLGLLPNGQILCLQSTRADLYPPVSTASGEPLNLSYDEWKPLKRLFISWIDEPSLSNVIVQDDSCRFVFYTRDFLHGIIIRTSPGLGPDIQIVPIANLLCECQYKPLVLSGDFVLAWSGPSGLVLRRVAWKPDFASPHVRLDRREPLDTSDSYSYHLDSTSGRIVIKQPQEIVVQSFACL
ncbi:hypothetical protein BDN72DRAFT_583027 [Pluteus cervinus]|uniref:Uncharacterized protein n=1 Tax=Pluteus cervinus TaxID=181527 RepID=A0ACD3AY22_9AGAR|nr:hypothetical protein BDN72DRAFT_583027 [Pluteus cervinus]